MPQARKIPKGVLKAAKPYGRCFDLGKIGMAITEPSHGILEVNDHLSQLLGYAKNDLVKMTWVELIHPDDLNSNLTNFNQVLLGQTEGYSMENRLVCKEGSAIDVTVCVKGQRRADGMLDGYVIILQDNTEGKRMQESLRGAQEQLSHVLTHGSSVLYTLRVERGQLVPVIVSRNIERMLGFTAAETANYGWWLQNLHPEDRDRVVDTLSGALSQEGYSMEYQMRHKDGTYRWIEDNNRVMRNASGQPTEMVGAWTDITQRKRSDEARKMQGHVLESMAEGVIVCDAEGRLVFSNAASDAMFGYGSGELDSWLISDSNHVPPEPYRRFVEELMGHLKDKDMWMGEAGGEKKDGSSFITRSRVSVLKMAGQKSIVAVSEDITLEKSRETQFLRSQRMESVGTLSSGIVHDLNNILTPILLSVSLLRGQLSQEEFEQTLHTIETCTHRGVDIIKQLLAFGRGKGGRRVILQPSALVDDVMEMMRETFPKNILLSRENALVGWPIIADATQVQQVLLNLCVNARDAMPEGGKLSVGTANVRFPQAEAGANSETPAGPYVSLRVSDTGGGIPPEVMSKIFDPFFTTKEQGKGTGLGLSTVLGIVKSHHGFIKIHNQVGGGCMFEVCLPAAPGAVEHAVATPPPAVPSRGRGEMILVVDDEPGIRLVVENTLMHYGYQVITAGDGFEAMMLYSQHRKEIKAVLTDSIMPFMDGTTLIRKLKEQDPAIKIVAFSGMAKSDSLDELNLLGVNRFLPKPFTGTEMLSVIGELLYDDEPAMQA